VTITANGLTEQHRALARRLMRLAWDTRDYLSIVHYRVPEAVERAQARLNATPAPMGPVVLADYTDGPMGGGHGDGTELLAALLAVDLPGTVVGPIYDPESVKLACNVPLGESLELEIGGKQDPEYGGGPVHVTARVEAFSDGSYVRRGPYATGSTGHMGRSVLVSVGNVKVLLVSLRCQPEDQEQFRIVGIEAREQRLLALKGINHFRADFEPIASEIIFVDSGGLVSVDFTRFPFRHVRRPIWPLDPDVTLPDEA
jgi:microcystin degradation protein MlrC